MKSSKKTKEVIKAGWEDVIKASVKDNPKPKPKKKTKEKSEK